MGLGLVLLGEGLFKIFIVLLLQLLSGLEKVPSSGVGVRWSVWGGVGGNCMTYMFDNVVKMAKVKN